MNKNAPIEEICEIYYLWKELNNKVKKFYTRGINLHEIITENIVCNVNNYTISHGSGSEDAIDEKNNKKIQIKGTSNFNDDLSSFGPKSEFDELHFARLNQDEDKIYLYLIPIKTLYSIKMNKNETFKNQQKRGVRPRFSIIKTYINPMNIKEYAIFDIKTRTIIK